MLQSVLRVKGVHQLNKNDQKSIQGGFNNTNCEIAISINGTLCLCRGWEPQNGICVNTNQ